jgi:hypothetical protein
LIRFPIVKRPRHADRPSGSRLRPIIVVLGVVFVIMTTLYGLRDNASRNKQSREIRNTQKCQQELNSLNAKRNLALTRIQNDDRHAVDKWIARVNLDIQTGQFKDLARAYEAYRSERIVNEKKRAKYGAGVKIDGNACDFEIIPATHSPVPSASVDPHRTVSPILPTLPPQRTVTRGRDRTTVTVTEHAASTRTVTRLEVRTRVHTVESTVTVTAEPTCVLGLLC